MAAGLLALAGSLAFIGCGPAEAPPAPRAPSDVSGRYEVHGLTATEDGGDERKIAGTVILEQVGDRYTATFELKTKFPGATEPSDADVIGVGEGSIAGSTLAGTAHTQIVVSSVPGVDTGFAFVPRMVSTRIESSSEAELREDGSISIVLANRAAPGEEYTPTRTRLTGKRISGTAPADWVASKTPEP